MKNVFEGNRIETNNIEELAKVVKEYNINVYFANWYVKNVDEFITYCKEIKDTSVYDKFTIELDYSNKKISWIGLTGEGDSYNPSTLYNDTNAKRSILVEVMTFAEASEKWGLGESTLRSTVKTDKLEENIDYKKSGKVWLITKDAMLRLYGEPKKFIKNVTYEEMEKFIISNVKYTYNVALCLKNFIGDLGETGAKSGEFYMTEEQEHFEITQHSKIENEDTDDEEIIITYDVFKK